MGVQCHCSRVPSLTPNPDQQHRGLLAEGGAGADGRSVVPGEGGGISVCLAFLSLTLPVFVSLHVYELQEFYECESFYQSLE